MLKERLTKKASPRDPAEYLGPAMKVVKTAITDVDVNTDTWAKDVYDDWVDDHPNDAMHGYLEAGVATVQRELADDPTIRDLADEVGVDVDELINALTYHGYLDTKACDLADAHGYVDED